MMRIYRYTVTVALLLLATAVAPSLISGAPIRERVLFEDQKPHVFRVTEAKAEPTRFAIPEALTQDNDYLLRFELRSLGERGEIDQDAGQAGLVVQVGKPGVEKPESLEPKLMESIALASGDWQSFEIPFSAVSPVAAGEGVVQFSRAYFRQPAQIRGLKLLAVPAGRGFIRSGRAYAGQEPDAAWRREAERRILNHRTGPLVVNVTNVLNGPVQEADVDIEMTRHAYLFGTAIVASRVVDAPLWERREHLHETTFLQDNQRYRSELQRLFNFTVFENGMKWPVWLNQKDWAEQSWTLDALQWLRDNDFAVKGHTMVWASWPNTPGFLRRFEDDPEFLQSLILGHIRDLGNATRNRVEYFDVLNEPMSHRDLIEILGNEAVAEWFQEAREALPGTRLLVNDFDLVGNGGSPKRRQRFIQFVEDIREKGAPVDMIGFQSHFWSPRLTAPEEVWKVIDEFEAALGLPLMVSEFDMNILDEQLQAEYTRDFLTAWFAHPATEAFIMWGFWGGAHWMRDAGAMYRRDWSEKPNLKAYTDLVLGEWWTRDSIKTDTQGRAVLMNAFFGDYEIRVHVKGQPVIRRTWKHGPDTGPLIIHLPSGEHP